MNKQGLDLHVVALRIQNFQMKARNKAKHNSAKFGFFRFSGAP